MNYTIFVVLQSTNAMRVSTNVRKERGDVCIIDRHAHLTHTSEAIELHKDVVWERFSFYRLAGSLIT
jgi:hypothetical protein